MPHEHDTLCPVCRSVAPNFGAETTWHSHWEAGKQEREKATGARLNTRKSKALAVGGWNTTTVPLGIPYANEVKILGITSNTIERSTEKTWEIVTKFEPRRGTLTPGTYAFLSRLGMRTHTS